GLLEVNSPLIEEQAAYRVLIDRESAERVAHKVFGDASVIIAVSDELVTYLEGFPGARGKVRVVPNGVNPDWYPSDLTPSLPAEAQFAGAVAHTDIPGLLASMDVAVAPYPNLADFYFSPLKVYEYMAAGLPVVVSNIGQLGKLINHGVNGLLVPAGDAGALAH